MKRLQHVLSSTSSLSLALCLANFSAVSHEALQRYLCKMPAGPLCAAIAIPLMSSYMTDSLTD